MHRRLAELDRLDRRYGLGAMPVAAPRRRTRTGHGPFWPSLLVTVVVLVAVLALTPGVAGVRLRSLVGLGDHRLHETVSAPQGRGGFRFTQHQPGSTEPVSYNPCRPIRYVVNPSGAPGDYLALVQQSVAEVARATGFEFEYDGTTGDRDFEHRGGMSVRSTPVLIGWATPGEVPGLAGDVAGLGGSTAVERTPDHLTFVTGMVTLDRDVFARLDQEPGGFEQLRAIVMHELGHVVGLAHVDDPTQLMYHDNNGRLSFGAGDLRGLASPRRCRLPVSCSAQGPERGQFAPRQSPTRGAITGSDPNCPPSVHVRAGPPLTGS